MLFEHRLKTFPRPMKNVDTDGERVYTDGTVVYPSVTNILKSVKNKGLDAWKRRVGAEAAQKHGAMMALRGKSVHSLCESYVRNEKELPKAMPDAKGIFYKMKPYINLIGPVYSIEGVVYSDQYKFAGRVDCIGHYQNVPSIIDFKTTNSEITFESDKLEGYKLQLAAYSIAWKELTSETIDQGILIFGSNDYGAKAYKINIAPYRPTFLEIAQRFLCASDILSLTQSGLVLPN